MIIDTDYQRGGAGDLLSYMEREDHSLHNHVGEKMTHDEKAEFLKESQENEFERQIIISPERDDLTDEQLHRSTRETMTEFLDDQPTARYCYSVHNEDDESGHVHVAATGDIDNGDLFMRRDDIQELRDEIAADRFADRTLEQRREQLREQNQEQNQEQQQESNGYIPEETWRARLEAMKEARREDRSRAQLDHFDDDDKGKVEQIRDVVEKEQSRGVAGDIDTDYATGAVLAEIDDIDQLDSDSLKRETREVVHDLGQDHGVGR